MSDLEPNKNSDPLASFFNVPAVVDDSTKNTSLAKADISVESELEEDFRVARENMQQAVELSRVAVEDMARIAKQMEQPRAYDAFSKIMAATIMANKALLEIHKHKQDVDQPVEPSGSTYVTNNTVVMTTAEMQRRIDDARRKALEDSDEVE